MWYAGMKQYVHRVYGPHLFEPDYDDDETTESKESKEDDY
jgi:hypothetical protein